MQASGLQLVGGRASSPRSYELSQSGSFVYIFDPDSFWCTIRDTWQMASAVVLYTLDLSLQDLSDAAASDRVKRLVDSLLGTTIPSQMALAVAWTSGLAVRGVLRDVARSWELPLSFPSWS